MANYSKLADWSEIVSSVAIVVTLVYLAVEITQNTKALQAQTSQAVLESAQTELYELMENPDLALTLGNDEPLTELQHVRLDSFLTAFLRSREFAWLLYEDGAIGQEQWNTELAVLMGGMGSKKPRLWWHNHGRHSFSDEFVTFVDSTLRKNTESNLAWSKASNWSESDESD
jgi:hypothetical protein